jgi:hypothetical protein
VGARGSIDHCSKAWIDHRQPGERVVHALGSYIGGGILRIACAPRLELGALLCRALGGA